MTRSAILLLVCVVLAGCGESGPEVVPVRGKITFGGGDWPGLASAYFTSAEAASDQPQIPAQATLEPDGSFVVDSAAGNGLVPGKYRVAVECWKLAPDESRAESPLGVSHVPERYRNPATSELGFEVKSGESSVEVSLDVPKQ